MKINTKVFGEIDIEESKIITFENGIIGFPEMKSFTLLYNEEEGASAVIRWLQSIEEPGFAIPVTDPFEIVEDYSPEVDDELLKSLGGIDDENGLVLVSITIPKELTKMSINLQGPFIINVNERKGCQVIVEGGSYPVKYYIYDILKARKGGE